MFELPELVNSLVEALDLLCLNADVHAFFDPDHNVEVIHLNFSDRRVILLAGDVRSDLMCNSGRFSNDFLQTLEYDCSPKKQQRSMAFIEETRHRRLRNYQRKYGPHITLDMLPHAKEEG